MSGTNTTLMSSGNPHVLAALQGGLIVSCQAEGDDPFNRPEYLQLFAGAAEMGGARGLRACGAANIRALRAVPLPIVGITKGSFPDGSVLITADLADVEAILEAGAEIVAVDATERRRPNGLSGSEFVAEIKKRWPVPVLADVSTRDEAKAAADAGADAVATTLAGYTPATAHRATEEPDWQLLAEMVGLGCAPVVMEGRIWTPNQARRALDLGAFAVVVGTAITRPRLVTMAFVKAMERDAGES